MLAFHTLQGLSDAAMPGVEAGQKASTLVCSLHLQLVRPARCIFMHADTAAKGWAEAVNSVANLVHKLPTSAATNWQPASI